MKDMNSDYLNGFEIAVINDIRKNNGVNLQSIIEQNFYGYSECGSPDWMYNWVYRSICLKLFTDVEFRCLTKCMIDDLKKDIPKDEITKRFHDAVYMKLKYLDEERLEEKIH